MNDKTFLGKLETSVEAIKKADDGKGANKVLFQTMKMLLRKIDNSDKCLADYDEDEIMQHFLSFETVAQSANDFFKACKGYELDEDIKQSLGETTKEIARVNKSLEDITKNGADLLRERKELEKVNDKHKKLSDEISRLRKIKETVTPDILKAMESEAEELDRTNKQNQKRKHELEGQINDLKKTSNALAASTAKVDEEVKVIVETVTSTIDARIEDIKGLYDKGAVDVERLKAEIGKYKEQYAQLGDRLAKNREEHDFYAKHLGENSDIIKKLKEYGVRSIDDFFNKDIAELKSSVEASLARFDGIIEGVIKVQEEAKESIEEHEAAKENTEKTE